MRDSYQKGKDSEKQACSYLEMLGFVRPGKGMRKKIKQGYEQIGISINSKGFDLIKKDEINDPTPTLYELKTAGKDRKSTIADDWKGLGFTLTHGEEENANVLGKKYKFIWLDLKRKKHRILYMQDFLNEEKARIYNTKSVFIRGL